MSIYEPKQNPSKRSKDRSSNTTTLSAVVDHNPLTVEPDMLLSEVIVLMGHQGVRSQSSSGTSSLRSSSATRSSYALVMNGPKLCGILTERDIVKMTAQGNRLTSEIVADVMTQRVITLGESDLQDPFSVLSLFRKYRIRHLPILDPQGQVIGIVTSNSILQTLQSSDLFRLRRVEEVMTQELITASPEQSVCHLAQLMASHRVSCVVITSNTSASSPQVPLGIVTERDIVQFQALGLNLMEEKAESVMSHPLHCLNQDDSLWMAHQAMEQLRVRRLVVSDNRGAVAGILTQTSILSALDPMEIQRTITALKQQVDQLQDERVEWLKVRASTLETQVQSTEQRFQAIFNQTFQFIGLLTPDGTLIEANQTMLDFSGSARSEVIDRPFWETSFWSQSPENQLKLKDSIAKAAQGEFIRYEVEIMGATQIATIDFSLRPMQGTTHQVQLLILEGRDISNRKRAEAAQRQSEQHFANLAEVAPVGIFQTDVNGECLYVNERWCQIAGMTLQQAKGPNWLQGIYPADRQAVLSEWNRATQTTHPFYLEYRFQSSTGAVTWVLGQAIAEVDSAGTITGYIGTITDISDRKQAELDLVQLNQNLEARVEQRTIALKTTQEGYRLLCEKTPVMLHSVDNQGRLCRISNFWLEHLGYTSDEVLGQKISQFFTQESRIREETEIFPNFLKTGSCFEVPYQVVKKDGSIIDVLLSATRDRAESGEPISLAVMVDVTQRNQIEQALFREKELAQVTLHSIGDAVITTNSAGIVEYFNPVAEQLTGYSAADAVGKPLTDVFHIVNEVTRKKVESPIHRVLNHGQVTGLANHTVLIARDGTEVCIEDSAAPIRNRKQEMIGAVLVFHDVTHSRQLAHQLSWQASHDALTGLVNRRQFEQELNDLLPVLSRETPGHVLCYLDLDQFKVVNDTCGHMAGDELLRQVSQLLTKSIRSMDVLARLGGDEFGILLKQCPVGKAEIVAEKIRNAIYDFRFVWADKVFRIGVSIGLVSIDSESHSYTDVMSSADAACYAAKEGGRNRVHRYQVDDSDLVRQRGERRWSVLIKQALEDNRFCLYQQPIVHTAMPDLQRPHYEILLRLLDEQGKLISPGTFIPAAERYNLMTEIDCWVVQTFFTHLAAAQERSPSSDHEPLYFINLSGASVGNSQFLAFVKTQFSQLGISPTSIGFEITETAAIANLGEAPQFIQDLKQLGCCFALDDFGSGMSSFGYLKNLPVDFLKIDGEFIVEVLKDTATQAIVESINHIGHVLGLKTVAESVENQAIQAQMTTIGVDYLQGFGIARPAPII